MIEYNEVAQGSAHHDTTSDQWVVYKGSGKVNCDSIPWL